MDLTLRSCSGPVASVLLQKRKLNKGGPGPGPGRRGACPCSIPHYGIFPFYKILCYLAPAPFWLKPFWPKSFLAQDDRSKRGSNSKTHPPSPQGSIGAIHACATSALIAFRQSTGSTILQSAQGLALHPRPLMRLERAQVNGPRVGKAREESIEKGKYRAQAKLS